MNHPDIFEVNAQHGDGSAAARFDAFVKHPHFPCVGARSALNRSRLYHGQYSALGGRDCARRLHADLQHFSADFPDPGNQPVSFVAMFDTPINGEQPFEDQLWSHLQLLSDLDGADFAWDPSVSDDPDSDHFSMSVAGRAYFVVGLHPQASRLARQSPMPTLVFNFHNQFESLKATGKYASMQTTIRKRDLALQGSINPVLARFGESSVARQYAGREVPANWVCPFSRRQHVSI